MLRIAILAASVLSASDQLDFFEARIRPVLVKNCYQCHGPDVKTAMGGFYLHDRDAIRRGGQSGPAVVPGKPDEGTLLKALRYEGRKMPPSAKLPDSVIADFEKWIAMGAPDPRESKVEWKQSSIDIEKGRSYWAFQPPVKPAAPRVKNGKWSSQPIDRLLLAQMERRGVTPVADADRATLIRRLTFDITGLPPTPEEIATFLTDKHPEAYARLVDRLLDSKGFGERWGRHWLDVARYAESAGRGRNFVMPFAWRYRDYVIDSFNNDKPYNQFVMEQIAGDLMPATTNDKRNEQTIATGFLALGSHDLIEINPAVFRTDVVDEQINATSRAFLGLTVGCARCHDHKFDPIPTADYYAMAGIFRSTEMLSGLRGRPRDNVSYFDINLLARLTLPADARKAAWMDDSAKVAEWQRLNKELDQARQTPGRFAFAAARKRKGGAPKMPQAQLRQEVARILREMDRFELPRDLAMGVREGTVRDYEILVKGDVKQPGGTVPRGFVQVVSAPGERGFDIPANQSGRLQLARWMTRRDNPLTARVMANRVWQHLFGRGIVPTVDNFGKMGEQPTNQQLLDYLAVRFMEQGWSTKKVVREIVMSRAYRLGMAHSERNARIDPGNNLYWRQNRLRLEVEAIRDSILQVAGRLDTSRPDASPAMHFRRGIDIGRGPGRRPDDYSVTMTNRSVYVPVVRNFIPAMFETFDFPEPSETKGQREVTTVPTQALFLVNSPFVLAQAKSAAEHLLASGESTNRGRVTRMYREALSRDASESEIEKSMSFLDATRSSKTADADEKTAWARLYQALFATAEFRYR